MADSAGGIIIESSFFPDPVADNRFFLQSQRDQPASLIDGAHPSPMNFLPMAGEPPGDTIRSIIVQDPEGGYVQFDQRVT